VKKTALSLLSFFIIMATFTGCNKKPSPAEDSVEKTEEPAPVISSTQDVEAQAEAAHAETELLRTDEILAALKKIPTSEYKKNYVLYQELVSLHPDNERYREKMRFYERERTETELILVKLKRIPVVEYRENYDLYKRLSAIHPDNKYYGDKMEFYADKLYEISADGCFNNGEISGKTLTLTIYKCRKGARFQASSGALSRQFSKIEVKKIRDAVAVVTDKGYHSYRDKEKLYRKPGVSIYTKLYSEENWFIIFAFNSVHESPPNASVWITPQDIGQIVEGLK